MFDWVRSFRARRLLRHLIAVAIRAAYSEQVEFDAILARLCPGISDLDLLRSYVVIHSAARLQEPLTRGDVASALRRLSASAVCAQEPAFPNILDTHRQMAELCWMRRKLLILRGKLAHQRDAHSCEGAVYQIEHLINGPCSKADRIKMGKLTSKLVDLNVQIETKDLAALADQDADAYSHHQEKSNAIGIARMAEGVEALQNDSDFADWMTELETTLAGLLASPHALAPSESNGLAPFLATSDAFDAAHDALDAISDRADTRRAVFQAHLALHEATGARFIAPTDYVPYSEDELNAHTVAIDRLTAAFDDLSNAFGMLNVHAKATELYNGQRNLYAFAIEEYYGAADSAFFNALRFGVRVDEDEDERAQDATRRESLNALAEWAKTKAELLRARAGLPIPTARR